MAKPQGSQAKHPESPKHITIRDLQIVTERAGRPPRTDAEHEADLRDGVERGLLDETTPGKFEITDKAVKEALRDVVTEHLQTIEGTDRADFLIASDIAAPPERDTN